MGSERVRRHPHPMIDLQLVQLLPWSRRLVEAPSLYNAPIDHDIFIMHDRVAGVEAIIFFIDY